MREFNCGQLELLEFSNRRKLLRKLLRIFDSGYRSRIEGGWHARMP